MDMSIDEFETVGTTVKAFAAENATVIVGTVIDPDMSEEMRVTVVATGIGAERKPDISLVNNGRDKARETGYGRSSGYQGGGAATARVLDNEPEELEQEEYEVQLEKPASKPQSSSNKDMDYLDIPAFLRRQVD